MNNSVDMYQGVNVLLSLTFTFGGKIQNRDENGFR